MILPYKFYYKENDVLCIKFFRTLKEIKTLLKENPFIPIQINKYNKGVYEHFKIWSII